MTRPTQMIILPVKPDASIEDTNSKDGGIWSAALGLLERAPGFRRLYWGRHIEEEEKTQIHVGTLSASHILKSEPMEVISARYTTAALCISKVTRVG